MHEDITAFSYDDSKRPFEVTMCGISYCDGTYKINRLKSNIWCVEYVIKGEGYIRLDDISFSASEGDIYILPAGRKHIYYSDDKNPWEKIWFNIRGDLIEKLMESYNIKHVYHVRGLNLYSRFKDFIDTAKTAADSNEVSRLCAQCFLKIVQEISEYVNAGSIYKSSAARLKEKIDGLTEFGMSFDSLIEDMHYTKSHIIRAFKAEFKITPYSYLLEKKMSVAKMMIENTNMSIMEISDFLGFSDCHYFSNFFKKYTGISPKKYRREKSLR